MTSDPTYTPSPELVEVACCYRTGAQYVSVHDSVAAGITAAVAYRTPTGDPELAPWEQVRELVDAATVLRKEFAESTNWRRDDDNAPTHSHRAPPMWDAEERGVCSLCTAWINLRAALAPFTQEPTDG